LPAGHHEFTLLLRRETQSPLDPKSRLILDVAADFGRTVLHEETLNPAAFVETRLIVRRLSLSVEVGNVEIRLVTEGPDRWTVSFPVIREIDAAELHRPEPKAEVEVEAEPPTTGSWLKRLFSR
jgi:NAD-dependent oxidoreductase involved in siderophore biosynthesis